MDYINVGTYTINKNAIAFINWDACEFSKAVCVTFLVGAGLEGEFSGQTLHLYGSAAGALALAFGRDPRVYESKQKKPANETEGKR